MDSSTAIGLGIGLGILVLSLILGHVPPATLLNPEAILIVFGGTLAATMVSFNGSTIKAALGALNNTRQECEMTTQETVQYVMEVVNFIRDEGILALQPMLSTIELPFFKKGLSLFLDNRSEKFIKESLSTEIEVAYRETLDYAKVFETAGGYAPTMGIIGAVIGLICVVQTSSNVTLLGQGVASAFSATLYGVAISNLVLLPIAAKLRQKGRNEWFLKTLLLEAILSIRAGEHPMIVEERLNAFLGGTNTDEQTWDLKPYATGTKPKQTLPVQPAFTDNLTSIEA